MKYVTGLFFCTITSIQSFSQQDSVYVAILNDTNIVVNDSAEADTKPFVDPDIEIYKLKPLVDVPLTAIGTGLSLLGFSKIYSKDAS